MEAKVVKGANSITSSTVGKFVGKTMNSVVNADIKHVAYIIIIIMVLFTVSWCLSRLNKNEKNCKIISDVYSKFPHISSMNTSVLTINDKLRDYYVKTAYNCCSSGNYKNDFVNICALKNCIKQGARCLDFEIYAVDKKPVIATSSTGVNFKYKETYNYVDFSKAMSIIDTYAFSSATCPNPEDPLILNFRIMSSITIIHDMISTSIYNSLGNRLLDKNFSYEMRGLNIGAYAITSLMGKIIIIVDKSNPTFYSSKLHEYVNITSSTPVMRSLRFNEVEFCPDVDELIYFNKEHMTIVLPSHSANSKNLISSVAMHRGCQFIGMSFQTFDVNMEFYTKFFDESGQAFVKRYERFLYKPQFIPIPTPQKTCVSLNSVVSTLGSSNIPVSLTSGESCNSNRLIACNPNNWIVSQIGGVVPLTTSPSYPQFSTTILHHVKMGGKGIGLHGNSDSFTFFSSKILKDRASLTAKVTFPETGSIGIMIRENITTPISKYISIGVETDSGNKNVYMDIRTTVDTVTVAGSSDNNPPSRAAAEQDTLFTYGRDRTTLRSIAAGSSITTIFIRIIRISSSQFVVTYADSSKQLDDSSTVESNTQTIRFSESSDLYIGLFVYSGNSNTLINTTFEHVDARCS